MSEAGDFRADFIVPPPAAPLEALAVPPKFSIVIPAYQAVETIGGALESALAQTRPAHEVIVVDDGSTDDLSAALAPYEERINLISKGNGGVASARNAGFAAASGDFMAVLDADDRFHPRRLEALAALALARPDLDLITTDTRFIVDGRPSGTFREANPFAVEEQRTAIFGSCFVGGWPAVRIERLRDLGGFDERLSQGEDWDCWLRLILDGSAAGLVDRPYYDYVIRQGSLTSDREASLWARVALLEKAASNPALQEADRPALKRAYSVHRARAVDAEVNAVLGGGGSRGKLARLAVSAGVETRTRALAGLTALAPALVRRLRPRA
jgi:hypothetical protein